MIRRQAVGRGAFGPENLCCGVTTLRPLQTDGGKAAGAHASSWSTHANRRGKGIEARDGCARDGTRSRHNARGWPGMIVVVSCDVGRLVNVASGAWGGYAIEQVGRKTAEMERDNGRFARKHLP